MKVLSKLSVAGRTLLTLEGDILDINSTRICVDGNEYDFDIAYDMKNTICIKKDAVSDDIVEFV